MSEIKTGGPAFPFPAYTYPNGEINHGEGGMTLRDYMAIHASDEDLKMQAEILRIIVREKQGVSILPDDWRSTARYMHADAMIQARSAK